MEKAVQNVIPSVVSVLEKNKDAVLTAFLGFDACIDNIVRIVRENDDDSDYGFFTTSRQFAEYLISRENKSCGIELQTRISKPGGNMVITANALGNLGIKAECAGTFGLPEVLPFFRSISSNCELHTIGDTITATALEFNNSKVILFDPGPYNNLSWNSIRGLIGTEQLKNILSGKQLISFLNWSEIAGSSEIWQGFLNEIIPDSVSLKKRPIFFTDFSDCSRKSKTEIRNAVTLLKRFAEFFKVILSLNHNEADLVASALDIPHNPEDEIYIRDLFKSCNSDILIIHRTHDAIACDKGKFEKCPAFLCKDPVVLTGGGDNFNAGFCYAQLQGFELFRSLVVANAVSGYYVKTGTSPDVDALIEFLN